MVSSYIACKQLISKVEKLLVHLVSCSSKSKTDCFLKHGLLHKGSSSFLFLRTNAFFFSCLNWRLVCSVSVWHLDLKAII